MALDDLYIRQLNERLCDFNPEHVPWLANNHFNRDLPPGFRLWIGDHVYGELYNERADSAPYSGMWTDAIAYQPIRRQGKRGVNYKLPSFIVAGVALVVRTHFEPQQKPVVLIPRPGINVVLPPMMLDQDPNTQLRLAYIYYRTRALTD